MATELDKLLVRMGIKEDNTNAGTMAGIGAGLGAAINAIHLAPLANPNDFGGRGKKKWMKMLEPILAGADGKRPPGFSPQQQHVALAQLGMLDNLSRMGKLKRNLVVGGASALGAGVMGLYGYGAGKIGDLIKSAKGEDTKWRDKDDIMAILKKNGGF